MLNLASSLLGPLEQSIMECFWRNGAQSSGQILATLRRTRTIAPSTVTTTLARLYAADLLIREPLRPNDRKQTWRYTPRHASRGALLAGAVEQLFTQLGADTNDRAEALGRLLGVVR
jgi:predicted transcriptional regulator